VAGHTISTKYEAYKIADKTAGSKTSIYKKTSEKLKTKPPGPPENPTIGDKIKQKCFDRAGYRVLGPRAGDASVAAEL
jgi:hypothetical protein